jgi:hypothetical protein
MVDLTEGLVEHGLGYSKNSPFIFVEIQRLYRESMRMKSD